MSGFKTFRDGFIGPVLILACICLLTTWAVSATFGVTAPIIQVLEAEKQRQARQEVLPAADDFTLYENVTLPEGVTEAYKANNGAGYVFAASARGYDGLVPFTIGLDARGNVTGIKMLTNNETKGLGSRVGEADYLIQYMGQSSADAVDGISGATLTSTALKNSLRAVLEAFETLRGVNP